jgi:hypothetical protein
LDDVNRELLCPTEKRKKNSWTKTGLRVRDGEGDRCSRASTAYISPTAASAVARRPGGGGGQRMGGATAWIGDGSNIDGSTTSVAIIAGWRARNSNLVHRGVDIQQGDAIPISDQVRQKDSSTRLKASHREPSTGSQPLIPHALKQQRRRCGRCCGLRLRRWRIGVAAT